MNAKDIVINYWNAMNFNDFVAVSKHLSENFECYWHQSSELIRGRDNFAEINTRYPSNGKWVFFLKSIICEGQQVVTEVDITDGTIKARAITFHTIENGVITKQIEYWPEEYAAPAWRREWVELVESS